MQSFPTGEKKGVYRYVSLLRLTSRADLSSVRFITAVNIVFTDFRKVTLSPAAGASATPGLLSRFQAGSKQPETKEAKDSRGWNLRWINSVGLQDLVRMLKDKSSSGLFRLGASFRD